MTVTANGQVTIPENLREQFALLPGSEVEFIPEADALRIKARPPVVQPAPIIDAKSAARWLSKAAGSARSGLSTDQHMALTRGEEYRMSDFFIGAHAEAEDLILLTRDAARCGACFPAVRRICPG